jgi:hypothetical protein
MEFTIMLIVKQKLEEICTSETELICSVWTLEINTFRSPSFLKLWTLVEQVMENKFSFGSKV